jgi:hypothetical protein
LSFDKTVHSSCGDLSNTRPSWQAINLLHVFEVDEQ